MKRSKITMLPLAAWLLLSLSGLALAGETPRNIILFIGDGMGFEQVRAAGMYANGAEGTLPFESFPVRSEVTNADAAGAITDSAAAASAIATGVKVNSGVISMAYPGDQGELKTLVEAAHDYDKSTGLVTTAVMTHATPAAFGAHEESRNNYQRIAMDYLTQTRPNVMLGGGGNGLRPRLARQHGYTVVKNAKQLQAVNTESVTMLSGQFGRSHLPYVYDGLWGMPHLKDMTKTALAVLDNDPDGFFLLVEGGRIDHAGHDNDLKRTVHETVAFAEAVQVALDWAAHHDDTLIIVTADHETGGLHGLRNQGKGRFPEASWSTKGHTGVNIPLYAWGRGAEEFAARLDNTDFYTPLVTAMATKPMLATADRRLAAVTGSPTESRSN